MMKSDTKREKKQWIWQMREKYYRNRDWGKAKGERETHKVYDSSWCMMDDVESLALHVEKWLESVLGRWMQLTQLFTGKVKESTHNIVNQIVLVCIISCTYTIHTYLHKGGKGA